MAGSLSPEKKGVRKLKKKKEKELITKEDLPKLITELNSLIEYNKKLIEENRLRSAKMNVELGESMLLIIKTLSNWTLKNAKNIDAISRAIEDHHGKIFKKTWQPVNSKDIDNLTKDIQDYLKKHFEG